MDVLQITGKCDRTRYALAVPPGKRIFSVSYRDAQLPRKLQGADLSYPVPPNAQLNPITDPPDLIPDSEIAAFWFVRACYESFRRPAYYFFAPTQTLVLFPPVVNDGDKIIVQFDEKPDSG